MFGLNLPLANLKIRKQANKNFVLDRLRKQYVRLTPEEYVRQHFISFLIEHKNYPEGLLANEVTIELGSVTKRCDTVLYNHFLKAQMIVEYKAPTVTINQKTFDQIAQYNMSLQVPWLIVSNGLQHYCCHINETGTFSFVKDVPEYGCL
jgi:predicted type IV restriction endonuclease